MLLHKYIKNPNIKYILVVNYNVTVLPLIFVKNNPDWYSEINEISCKVIDISHKKLLLLQDKQFHECCKLVSQIPVSCEPDISDNTEISSFRTLYNSFDTWRTSNGYLEANSVIFTYDKYLFGKIFSEHCSIAHIIPDTYYKRYFSVNDFFYKVTRRKVSSMTSILHACRLPFLYHTDDCLSVCNSLCDILLKLSLLYK